jgi:hypothetical protein
MKPWRVQKFFGDLVYDLRSRGLLPVAILLVVGMFAVPIVISSSGSDSGGPAVSATPTAAKLAPENQAAVLAYNPGVRNYKERLNELSSQDPFVQQFVAPAVETTSLEQSVPTDSSVGTTGGGGSSPSTGVLDGKDGNGDGGGGSKAKVQTRYFFYETDVKVGVVGNLERKNDVDPFDYLPDEAAPVLVFMGNQANKKAVFLVSKEVTSLEGEGDCFPAPDACQLLALKAEESQRLVWGVDGQTYEIKVLRVDLEVTRKPPKG